MENEFNSTKNDLSIKSPITNMDLLRSKCQPKIDPLRQSNFDPPIGFGEIGLPDIQRPFVWKNSKVRDLFDSMYKGYPVGYLLFWQNR